jgi:MFS family permease
MSLRSFWSDLPREGRFLLSGVVFQFVGTGLIAPFHIIYLHEVRDFPLSTVGLLLALPPLVGFLAVGPGGVVIDRAGARKVMILSICLQIVGDIALVFASSLLIAAVGLVFVGLAQGLAWPATQTMIATVVPPAIRQRYFGVNFALLNLGFGLGGAVGGLLVDVDRLITFQAIYVVDAIAFLPPLVLVLGPLRHVAGRPAPVVEEHGAQLSYLAVLRQPAVGSLMFLALVASFVGYAQLTSGVPAFAREVGEVSTHAIGLAFGANALFIVVIQVFVLNLIEGRRRTRVIALMGGIWSVAWLILGLSGLVPGSLGAAILVSAYATVYAVGETLLQPTIPAMVNDLAPDHLRGRYNALAAAALQLPAVVAPVAAGFLIGQGLGVVYIGLLIAGSLALVVIALTWVEPQLPSGANGVHGAEYPIGVIGDVRH